jgi:osmotically-inducible protein OsmY
MINWNTRIPDGAIQVKVQNGWVTLSGAVAWQYQKAVAEDAIKSLSGVLGIANDIEVLAPASESDVRKLIMDALKRSAEIEAKAINVSVVDGKVTVEGQVKAWSERNAAVWAAWSAPGVNSVEDRLTVI